MPDETTPQNSGSLITPAVPEQGAAIPPAEPTTANQVPDLSGQPIQPTDNMPPANNTAPAQEAAGQGAPAGDKTMFDQVTPQEARQQLDTTPVSEQPMAPEQPVKPQEKKKLSPIIAIFGLLVLLAAAGFLIWFLAT